PLHGHDLAAEEDVDERLAELIGFEYGEIIARGEIRDRRRPLREGRNQSIEERACERERAMGEAQLALDLVGRDERAERGLFQVPPRDVAFASGGAFDVDVAPEQLVDGEVLEALE